jgi:hypothetical protein
MIAEVTKLSGSPIPSKTTAEGRKESGYKRGGESVRFGQLSLYQQKRSGWTTDSLRVAVEICVGIAAEP